MFIQNSLLINEEGLLREDLIVNRDYFLVRQCIWNQFMQWGIDVDVEMQVSNE